LPFLQLDHIYYDSALRLERLHRHRSRKTIIASDHLPLVADLKIAAKPHSGELSGARFHERL
jgi:endonuclease/exonuclease/phosphatase family metal-dependent hydrolase